MQFHSSYYLLESGKLADIANAFRTEHIKAHRDIMTFVEELGADGYRVNSKGVLMEVRFSSQDTHIHEGFKKLNKKRITSPRKKSALYEEFQLYSVPNARTTIQEHIHCPLYVSYKSADSEGSSCVGHPFDPIGLYWYAIDSPILLITPDVQYYINKLIDDDPTTTFSNNDDKWTLDSEGTRKILHEEWEFMRAKYNQENEQPA